VVEKVVALLRSFALHLILAENLVSKKNIRVLLKALSARSVRSEDVTLMNDIISTLRLVATSLPCEIEV
jgi:hypothetical protein